MNIKTAKHPTHVGRSAREVQHLASNEDAILVHRTKQGLTVLLRPRHTSPIVTIQAFVGVGSVDESKELYGAAHFFEHLIFKGTERRKVGRIALEVEEAGGHINAYTTFDHTVFYLTIPSPKLDTGLDILSDALIRHRVPAAELEREREVVIEEIRRGRDLPNRVAGELLFQTAFEGHPYGRPVIGFEESVKNMSPAAIRRFYERQYTSKNITLIVAGDFEVKSTLKKIEQYFRFRRTHNPSPRRMPRVKSKVQVRFREFDAQETHFHLAFPTVPVTHPDAPALDLWALLLGGDETSVLHRACVLDRLIANSVYAQHYTPKDIGLFIVGGTFPHANVEDGLTTIAEALQRSLHTPPSIDDFQRIKDHLIYERIYEKESVEGLARIAGFYQLYFGDTSAEETYFQNLQRLTPLDVWKAARAYLTTTNWCSALVVPPGKNQKSLASLLRNQLKKALTHKKVPTKSATSSVTLRPTITKHEPVLETLTHAEGSTSFVVRKLGHLPLVSLRWVQLGGLRTENAHHNGVALLMSQLWAKGSKNFSYPQILQRLKTLGGSVSAFSGKNSIGLTCDVPSRNLFSVLELFEDTFLNPTFSENDFQRERALLIEQVRTSKDSLAYLGNQLFLQTLYPTHAYGRAATGTEESLSRLTVDHVKTYLDKHFFTDGSVVAVAGDIEPETLRRRLAYLAGSRKGRANPVRVAQDLDRPPESPKRALLERPEANQAHIFLGFMGTTVTQQDRYDFKIISAILSGQGGRLFLDLRDRQSLAYSVTCMHSEGLDRGHVALYIACAPDKAAVALDGLRRHLDKLRSEKVSAAELDRAKAYLLGQHASEMQHHSTQSMTLALDQLYGIGFTETLHLQEQLEKVTAERLRLTAQRYFQPQQEVLAAVGPSHLRAVIEQP